MPLPTSHRRLTSSVSAIAAGILAVSVAGQAWAAEVADALNALARDTTVSERVSLKGLGITTPISLVGLEARREIYLPVPAGIPLTSPELTLDASYMRAEGGRTTFVVYLDGSAVSARSFTADAGKAGLDIGVDGAARPTGFVRLGLVWSSIVPREMCEDARVIGNILEVSPDSHFSYRYDGSAVTTIASAWSTLPQEVNLLVSGGTLDRRAYDTAWRLGLALERAGKRVTVATLPTVGDAVDLSGLDVPSALRSVPGFAGLAGGGRHTLASEAEVGALLLLGGPALRAHVAVADDAIAAQVSAAIAAAEAALVEADPQAQQALAELVRVRGDLSADRSREVSLAFLSGRPVITVAPDAGAAAAGLFDELWRSTAQAQQLTVNQARMPVIDGNIVPLTALAGAAGNLELLDRSEWSTSFDLASALADGKVPGAITLDVSAAPGATDMRPVASVFINDFLLGASRLVANGRPEQVKVRIPDYALLPRNVVRVDFRRQPSSNYCQETPQPFPVSVLPDGYLTLKPAPDLKNFIGLVPRLSGDASVFVPETWLAKPAQTLSTVIRVTDAGGISPALAKTEFAGETATPTGPFIAFDTKVNGAGPGVQVDGNRLILSDDGGRVFYDIAGLQGIGVLHATSSGGGKAAPGLTYHSVGDTTLQTEQPFRLAHGNLAIVGPQGVLSRIDTNEPRNLQDDDGKFLDPAALLSREKLADAVEKQPGLFWAGPVIILGLLVILIILARRARRRRSGEGQ